MIKRSMGAAPLSHSGRSLFLCLLYFALALAAAEEVETPFEKDTTGSTFAIANQENADGGAHDQNTAEELELPSHVDRKELMDSVGDKGMEMIDSPMLELETGSGDEPEYSDVNARISDSVGGEAQRVGEAEYPEVRSDKAEEEYAEKEEVKAISGILSGDGAETASDDPTVDVEAEDGSKESPREKNPGTIEDESPSGLVEEKANGDSFTEKLEIIAGTGIENKEEFSSDDNAFLGSNEKDERNKVKDLKEMKGELVKSENESEVSCGNGTCKPPSKDEVDVAEDTNGSEESKMVNLSDLQMGDGAGGSYAEGMKGELAFESMSVGTKLGEDPREKDTASLVFIFDTTGSMQDDLVQARHGAKSILGAFLEQEINPVSNYILVPFNDPLVGPVNITEEPVKFVEALDELNVRGGGDCPEMAATGILQALEAAHPNSYLYVFTDASAKDHYKYDQILELIQRKHSQIVFILTGKCRMRDHDPSSYNVFSKIATASSGQVFQLEKSNVEDVMKFVRDTLRARGVSVFSINRPAPLIGKPHREDFNVTVEKNLEKLTVTLTGNKPTVDVRTPSGETPKDLKTILDLPNVVVVNVDDPKPAGTWTVNVTVQPKNSSDSKTTPDGFSLNARTTGSTYKIHQGFSVHPAKSLQETGIRPLKGKDNYLTAEVDPLGREPENYVELKKYNWTSVDLMKTDGENIETLPLRPISVDEDDQPNKLKLSAGPFKPPNELFFLTYHGYDGEGNPVSRSSPNAISSQFAAAPLVKMLPKEVGFGGRNLSVKCTVESLIPFTLEWYKDGNPYDGSKVYEQSYEAILKIENVEKADEGNYSCKATNDVGSTLASEGTAVTVFVPPEIDETAHPNISVHENANAVLDCTVKSDTDYKVEWFLEDDGKIERLFSSHDNGKFQLLQNNSLLILSSNKEDSGSYICRATNLAGDSVKKVQLMVISPPEVITDPEGEFYFQEGENIKIECKSVGNTNANLSWEFNSVIAEQFYETSDDQSKILSIPNADKRWEGTYICVAVNEAGKAHKEVMGIYLEPPIAEPLDMYMAIKEGDEAVLECSVSGKPKPSISWFHNKKLLENNEKYEVSQNGLSLKIFDFSSTDEGSYECLARGPKETESKGAFQVILGTPPKPKHMPSDTTINLWGEGWFPCAAETENNEILYPELRAHTSWRKANGIPLDSKRHKVLESGMLHISNADIADEGVYICSMENDFGKIEIEMDLELTGFTPPAIIGMPEPYLEVPENNSLILDCFVVTDLNYDVQWIHDREGIQDVPQYDYVTGRIQLLENNSLAISSITKKDSGKYICSATNRAGTTNKEIEVNVISAPSIMAFPEDKFYFLNGDSININCTLNNDEPANIFWELNGVRIEQFSNSENNISKILSISEANKDWEGIFMCIAINDAGKVHQEIKGIYIEPPEIKSENERMAAKPNGTAEMKCIASGYPAPEIYWYHRDQILNNSEKYKISADGSSLKVLNLKPEDEGSYVCTAVGPRDTNTSTSIELILGRPPRPREPYPYASLKLGEEGSFPCRAEEDEKSQTFPGMEPRVSWRRKNRPLDSDRHEVLPTGTLVIMNSTTSDDGVYICTLENDYGKLDLEMDLEIIGLVPPVIIPEGDDDVNYLYNENITLWCNASGLPKPIVNWFFKGDGMSHWERLGKEFYDKETISITGGELKISNADYSHQGLYSCTAENEAGFGEKIYYLNMKAPPVLLDNDGPVDISLVEAENYSLHCQATGSPEPTIRWVKDGIELPLKSFDGSYFLTDGGFKLDILAERGNTDGFYTCIAENEAGKVEKSFKVKVLVPPAHANFHVQNKPASLNVKAGDSIKITCPIATGLAIPAPVYAWSKDGEMLHTEQIITSENGRSTGHLRIDDNGRSLYVEAVTLKDAGNYSCFGFNRAGRATAHAADVEVYIPSNHYPKPENRSAYEVIEGESVTFNCSFMGVPKPKIIWTKDGIYIPESHPEIAINHTHKEENVVLGQLSIDNSKRYHSGTYKCLSDNHIGKASSSFELDVLVPPIVEGLNNHNVEVVKGESTSLKCPIIGNPKPTITWHKLENGVQGKIREIHTTSLSTLELQNIHHDESGIYKCKGSNHIGSTEKTFNVSVLVAPQLEDDTPILDLVKIGQNVTLECNPDGNPKPSIVWFKNGYLLGNSFDEKQKSQIGEVGLISEDGRKLYLHDVDRDSDGIYSCTAFNKIGSTERTFTIETVAPPVFYNWDIPDMVKVLNGSSVKFDCSATGKPKPKIQWTRLPPKDELKTIQLAENNPPLDPKKGISTTSQLLFDSINVQNSAVYVCRAENKLGSSIKTFHLDVHIPPVVEGHIADENGKLNRIGIIKKQPGLFTIQVVEGQTFTLSCRILSGRPSPRLIWLKDEKRILKNVHQSQIPHRYFHEDANSIKTNGIYVIDSDETLVISNITKDESGPYKCVASNVAGTSAVHFDVEVFVPPTLEEGVDIETEYSVRVHSFIAITCPVTGKPDPEIRWFKDSEEIDEDFANMFQISQDRKRLIIMQAELENTGEYTCVATNDAGTRKINYRVSVFEEQMEWSPWSSWSACSSSCGPGRRKRDRECLLVLPNSKQIYPSYYEKKENDIEQKKGNTCLGDGEQSQKCFLGPCTNSEPEEYHPKRKRVKKTRSSIPKKATLNLQGNINGKKLNPSFASANYDQWNNGPTLMAELDLDPYEQGNLHPYLPFILSPVTWNTAGEIDEASNGFSLTDGVFEQRSQLEFMSGETLHLAHKGHGVDKNTGELKVHIEVEGEVPQYQSDALLYLEPFSEMYVQTSPSSVYAWSENEMHVNGERHRYKWNSSLYYDGEMGTMGYLAEQLSIDNLKTYNDYENRKIAYSATPKISKKYQTNRCPDGFSTDENKLHCVDVDECKEKLDKCHETQACKNEMGSYRCLCPKGFTSKNPGQKCIDVNECISEKKPCSHECHNIEGSFYCSCPKEMNLKSDGLTCENQEISYTSSKIMEKSKSTILDLLPDYHVIPLLKTKPPVHFWSITNHDDEIHSILNGKEISTNRSTSGWFDHADYQKCPSGYVSISGKCEDIDECTTLNRNPKMRHPHQKASPCPLPGQQCINTKGSFHCVEMSCTIGFDEVEVDFAHQNESLRYCLQLCGSEGLPCQEKAEIAEIIVNAIVTVNALRPRLALAQFSVPITAKNEKNQTSTVASTTRTTFHKLDEESASSSKQILQLFRVRSEGTEGILYSMKEFKFPGLYRVAVLALTYNGYSQHVLYATKFVINILVTGS